MKSALKALARSVAAVLALPALGSFYLRAVFLGRDRALQASSQALSLLPGVLGEYLRCAFFRRTLLHCHPTVTIAFGVVFSSAGARLDEYVYVGPRSHLGLVHLERDVLLGPGVHIPSGRTTHGIQDLSTTIREQPGAPSLVRVGAGSWVGAGAIVMADVGRDTVVGAGAVVTRPLPERVVAAGVPARVVKRRE